MANRDLDFSPTVTNVVAEKPDTSFTDAIANIGEQVANASAQTKALQASANTQVKLSQLNGQFRQKYADDPTNADGLKELADAQQQVVQTEGAGVPSIAMRDFTNKTIELQKSSKAGNEVWTTRQQVRNTSANMQTARVAYLSEANENGRNFAANGSDADLSTALNYGQANSSIMQFASPVIGKDKTALYLKSFNKDYVKSFVAGVAETNPARAAQLLESPEISDNFTTQDRGDMVDLIKRTQKQHELTTSLQTVKSNEDLTDLVNDPKKTYFEKRATIDQLEMSGGVTSKNASNARRVIKSSEDLEAQTDTPVMADIINRVYDLNQNTSLKPSEYLNGVHAVQDMIGAQQGITITGGDATKLQKEISTLTQKRMADATKSVGYQFGAANKKFNALPPEYRGEATRQLFYVQQGQNMSKEQLGNQADQIIDGINQKRRTDALSIVSRTTNDDVFLQATGYSREQVAATAKNRGISQEQVIQALRQKYTKKRPGAGPIKGLAPAVEEGDTTGIPIDEPAPPELPLDDSGEE